MLSDYIIDFQILIICNINTTNNSRNIQEITPNVVKVGSVYILTEEEYNHLCKCRGLLMDMLGTYKQFLQAYESNN